MIEQLNFTVKDVHQMRGLMDPDQFMNKAERLNLGRVKRGIIPSREILRQTGKTEVIISKAIIELMNKNSILFICQSISMGSELVRRTHKAIDTFQAEVRKTLELDDLDKSKIFFATEEHIRMHGDIIIFDDSDNFNL